MDGLSKGGKERHINAKVRAGNVYLHKKECQIYLRKQDSASTQGMTAPNKDSRNPVNDQSCNHKPQYDPETPLPGKFSQRRTALVRRFVSMCQYWLLASLPLRPRASLSRRLRRLVAEFTCSGLGLRELTVLDVLEALALSARRRRRRILA